MDITNVPRLKVFPACYRTWWVSLPEIDGNEIIIQSALNKRDVPSMLKAEKRVKGPIRDKTIRNR